MKMFLINKEYAIFLLKEFPLISLLFLIISGYGGTSVFYLGLFMFPIVLTKLGVNSKIDKDLFWLIIFSLSYAILSTINGYNTNAKGNLIFYTVYPPFFFMVGKYLMTKWTNQFYFIVLFLIFSLSIVTIIDIFQDIQLNGFINQSRAVKNRLGNDMAATLRGSIVSLGIATIALLLAPVSNSIEKRFKYLFLMFGILSLIVTFHLINRTGLMLLALSVVSVLLYNLQHRNKKKTLFLLTISIALITVMSYKFIEFDPIINAYQMRETDSTYGTTTAGGRLERWSKTSWDLINRPFTLGQSFVERKYYAHNLWLDVWKVAGFIPFTTLLFYTIHSIKTTYHILKIQNQTTSFFRSTILAIYFAFFSVCFVEPILEGSFVFILSFFLFGGMMSMIYKQANNENVKFF